MPISRSWKVAAATASTVAISALAAAPASADPDDVAAPTSDAASDTVEVRPAQGTQLIRFRIFKTSER